MATVTKVVPQFFMTVFESSVINLLTLAGLRTVFGGAGPSVTNLLTLEGLWTLF